jgi:hypothetical protein
MASSPDRRYVGSGSMIPASSSRAFTTRIASPLAMPIEVSCCMIQAAAVMSMVDAPSPSTQTAGAGVVSTKGSSDRAPRMISWACGDIRAGVDPQKEGEASLVVAAVVDDLGLEDGRVGQADVIAVQAQQDRGAAGQADDVAKFALDLDEVLGAERLADRQHDRGDEVFHRVAHSETDGEADDPRRPQDCAQKCGEVQQVKRQDDAHNHESPAGRSAGRYLR